MVFKKLTDKLGGIIGRRHSETGPIQDVGERRQSANRRRETRFDLCCDAADGDFVFLSLGTSEVCYPVRDLSSHGCSFEAELTAPEVLLGKELAARIHLGDTVIPITIEVMNYRQAAFGCAIRDKPDNWRREIGAYLDPLRLGRELREVDERFVKQDDSGLTIRWFNSPPHCDLYLWSDQAGVVAKAQLFLIADVVEWTPHQGLRTGTMSQVDTTGGRRGYDTIDTFVMHATVSSELLVYVRRLLGSSSLSPEIVALFDA